MESFPEVLNCKAVLDNSYEPSRLYALYIPTTSHTHEIRSFQETEEGQRLKARLNSRLLEEAIPDYIFTVNTLPVTCHGKLNIDEIKKQAREYLQAYRTSGINSLQKGQVVEGYMKEMLLISGEVDRSKTFIELGGNSFQAVSLVERLERHWDKITNNKLLDCILHQSIIEVIEILHQSAEESRLHASSEISKIKTTEARFDSERDIEKKSHLYVENQLDIQPKINSEIKETEVEKLKLRGDYKERNKENSLDEVKRRKLSHYDGFTVISRGSAVAVGNNVSMVTQDITESIQLSMKENWSVDLEKCIDASPLVVKEERVSYTAAYIGSHSGLFVAIDVETGKKLWQVRLPDRIESSACFASCKNLIVVGCYDHNIYFLDQLNGSIYWIFETLGPVKSSPTSDPVTGLVYVGSHDGNLYALHPATKECQWSVSDGGGSMFSSPCVDSINNSVYAASLSGKLLCMSKETGDVKWYYQCPKPLFSSPTVAKRCVILGCVDGCIYNFNHSGKLVYKIKTEAPVFSSPCLVSHSNREVILIGSHDGHVYSINLANGKIMWKTKIGDHVYSTPSCIFSNIDSQFAYQFGNTSDSECWTATSSQTSCEKRTNSYIRNGLVCCCSTNGTLAILDLMSGKKLKSHLLPGEIFSSSLFMEDGQVIVGCRNNRIYSISLDTG